MMKRMIKRKINCLINKFFKIKKKQIKIKLKIYKIKAVITFKMYNNIKIITLKNQVSRKKNLQNKAFFKICHFPRTIYPIMK